MSVLAVPKGLSAVLAKAPTDVVILSALRTPICRAYKGQLKDAYPEELLAAGRVNPDGGAIALGHPLGATGARMTATLVHGLRRGDAGELGVVSMCVGTGMGMAALFVRE
ncbi:Thiolase [Ophiocordyceps sinensis CO18]|uniref:Thiolase n=1 Tax=Ophiocordyceps sinensis (strain Co18 / CGMCC 3.14243) TaxID=911162 RepID=T5AEA2_OPHSC|nr:Thiolase [Ophiocordyceps sinensis CO18]